MMDTEEDARLFRIYRKKPLFNVDALTRCAYSRSDIQNLIPHRDPVLFVDAITHIDESKGQISGIREISPHDPVFAGHFPSYPVYPGCFVIESVGQLALCLHPLIMPHRAPNEKMNMYLARIVGALFLNPILPNTIMRMLVTYLPQHGMYHRAIGQALDHDGKIATVMIAEILIK